MHGEPAGDASYDMLKELLTGMHERIAQLEKEKKEKPQLLSRIVVLEKEIAELKKRKRSKE